MPVNMGYGQKGSWAIVPLHSVLYNYHSQTGFPTVKPRDCSSVLTSCHTISGSSVAAQNNSADVHYRKCLWDSQVCGLAQKTLVMIKKKKKGHRQPSRVFFLLFFRKRFIQNSHIKRRQHRFDAQPGSCRSLEKEADPCQLHATKHSSQKHQLEQSHWRGEALVSCAQTPFRTLTRPTNSHGTPNHMRRFSQGPGLTGHT